VVNPAVGTSGRPVSVLAVMAHADDGGSVKSQV